MTNKKNWSEQQINSVWNKAITVSNIDSNIFRQDYAGAWIKKTEYGNTDSVYGWEIDHRKPVAQYGSDDLANLVPLHWENNRSKSDDYPNWETVISSNNDKNIRKKLFWKIKS